MFNGRMRCTVNYSVNTLTQENNGELHATRGLVGRSRDIIQLHAAVCSCIDE